MRRRILIGLTLAIMVLAVPAIALGNTSLGLLGQTPNAPQATHGEQKEARPWIGALLRPLNSRQAQSLGLGEGEQGVLVLHIISDSSAQAAGLQRGDVIVAVGDSPVKGKELHGLVRSSSPGDTLTLSLLRSGETLSVDLVVGTDPTRQLLRPQRPPFLSIVTALAPHLQQAQVTVLDQDGNPVTLSLVAGSVVAPVEDGLLVMAPSDGGEPLELQLGDGVHIFGKGKTIAAADLLAGDQVIVLERDGLLEAVLVKPIMPAPRPRPLRDGDQTVRPDGGDTNLSVRPDRRGRGPEAPRLQRHRQERPQLRERSDRPLERPRLSPDGELRELLDMLPERIQRQIREQLRQAFGNRDGRSERDERPARRPATSTTTQVSASDITPV